MRLTKVRIIVVAGRVVCRAPKNAKLLAARKQEESDELVTAGLYARNR
jgi:hypothetical protein